MSKLRSPVDFRLLFENSPGLFLVLDKECFIVAATEAYLRATNSKRDTILGRKVFDIFPDEPSADAFNNLRASLERAVRTRQPDTMMIQRYAIQKPESEGGGFEERFWSPVNAPVYHPDGTFAFFIHRVEDVTALVTAANNNEGVRKDNVAARQSAAASAKDMEFMAELLRNERSVVEALRESEEQLRTLINSIPQLAWMARADGWIFWYNQRWFEYTGKTPAEMEGWGWQSVHDPAELPRVLSRWQASIASGEPFDMVFPLLGHDNIFRPFLTRVLPLRNAKGQIVRWFGTNTDLTELQKREEELQQAVAERTYQLRRSMDEMETFTYSVSHDLRSPVRAIEGFAQVLLEEYAGRLDQNAVQYIDRIKRAAERMMHLIHDLLDYSQLGKITLELGPVDLRQAVLEANKLLEVSGTASVEIDVPREIKVMANSAALVQVISNLVSNGLKFCPPGRIPLVQISAATDNGRARLFVRDNGIGISLEYQEKIFKVFERLHGSTTYPGTGIGLAIVARAIERMNGRYGVESQKDKGSQFWLELPIASPVPEETRS